MNNLKKQKKHYDKLNEEDDRLDNDIKKMERKGGNN